MTSQLALFDAGNIEIIYDADNQRWFKRAHVGRSLGLKYIHKSIPEAMKCEQRTRSEIKEGCKPLGRSKNPHDMFISVDCLKYILCKCTKPAAITLAKSLNFDILGTKCLKKEAETLQCIMKAFKGEDMQDQFWVDGYRVDLYFQRYKLAIECNEFGHQDRDIGYEVTRQKHIETKLGCTFIRYNPDAQNFDIFNVINKIFKHITTALDVSL